MMVPTMNSLFQHACMNKSVRTSHVQAGQFNHVQARQQAKTSCAFLLVYTSSQYNNVLDSAAMKT